MSLPAKHWLDSLDKLEGAPKVTHPHGGTGYPRIERVFTAPKGQESVQPSTLTDYPGSVLVFLEELSRDHHRVKLYVRYDTLPGPWITSNRIDPDGVVVTVKQRANLLASITAAETLITGVWTRTTQQPDDAYTGQEVVETRAIPGNAMVSKRIDEDSIVMTETRTMKAALSITPGESLNAGTWTRITSESVSDLVAWEISVARSIPGNLLTTKVYDSFTNTIVSETRQLKEHSASDPSLDSKTTDFKRIPQGNLVDLFVIREYPSGITSATVTEFKRERFAYAAIQHEITLTTAEKLNGEKLTAAFVDIEAERIRTVPHKVVTTFTTTQPTASDATSDIYDIRPIRHNYNGIHFDVSSVPVLADGGFVEHLTDADDPVWGVTSETYTWGDSTPTATAYLALRTGGSWMLIDREYKKLAKSLWAKIEVSVPAL